ncbi:MAG TPA: DUF885 domain-containing protein [Acidimicrobiales bacterium]|nr:DUF885 domain-containing protein [Acidimicrobiales bacterium]
MTTAPHRSDIFALASQVIERDAKSNPLFATEAGITSYDHLLPDFSPARNVEEIANTKEFLAGLSALRPVDDNDRIAVAVLDERLNNRLRLMEAGEFARVFSVIDSPASLIRQVFELMDCGTDDQRSVIAQRLRQIRPAYESWRHTLEELATNAQLPSRRHLVGIAEQLATYASGGYLAFAQRVEPDAERQSELVGAANDADAACGELSAWITETLVPQSIEKDAVGVERYRAWSQYWNGATLDLEELYAWGYADLRRINHRMWEIARELVPDAGSLVEVANYLDADPARAIVGTDELLRRLISFTNEAIEALDGVHFDIDERIRFCDARLAPEGSAGAPYYQQPSEDLSRPGTTWFPTLGLTTFSWWRNASTWYHEGVPGHHLQVATSIIEADRQCRFQRLEGMVSGHCEGWALYAERLMDELGFFSDLGDEMGYLANQALRAARVVVDIGLHLELKAPDDLGQLADLGDCSGQVWNAAMAVAVLEEFALQSHDMSASEVDRYLGVPAQAISYKAGERVWMRSREEAKSRLGADFSLKKFHAYALALGPMGLDPFEAELAKWTGA